MNLFHLRIKRAAHRSLHTSISSVPMFIRMDLFSKPSDRDELTAQTRVSQRDPMDSSRTFSSNVMGSSSLENSETGPRIFWWPFSDTTYTQSSWKAPGQTAVSSKGKRRHLVPSESSVTMPVCPPTIFRPQLE